MLAVAEHLSGQLTATLHLDEADHALARKLLPILERKAGRILANGYPNNVEVSHAMVHGGPFPASSDSRSNENEADLIGLELSARAGYNPNAAITLWNKMAKASEGAPPEFMSTHPASDSRIASLQAAIPKVMPLYQQAKKS